MTKLPVTEQLQKIIDGIISPETRRKIIIRAAAELHDRAAVYPEAGAWNSAPGTRGDNHWYQRLYGARWKRKNDTLGGRNTSQQLQKSWRIEAQGETASVFTEATYAPHLMDATQRVYWAERHGWQTTDEIVDDYLPRLEKIALEELDK
jgi:hypothetical protein